METPLFSNRHVTLFSNGTLGIGDGDGFIGSLNDAETRELFTAMCKYYYELSLNERNTGGSKNV